MAKIIYSQKVAVTYMAISMLLFSLFPLLLFNSDAGKAPLYFNFVWKLSIFVGVFIFLFIFYRPFISSKVVWKIIGKNIVKIGVLLIIVSQFEYLAFIVALTFIDISIVSIIYEIYPMLFAFYLGFLYKLRDKKSNKVSSTAYILMPVGFVGTIFIISSKYGGFDFPSDADYILFFFGVFLSFLSAILAMFSAHAFIWSEDLVKQYTEESRENLDKKEFAIYEYYTNTEGTMRLNPQILFTVIALGLSALFVGILSIIFGVIYTRPDSFVIDVITQFDFIFPAVLGGGVLTIIASISWRKANLITTDLSINAISYMTPIFAVIWLYFFNAISVQRIDFLSIGIIIIVVINILINFNASVRLGYKILILSLWSFGTIIYLYEGIELREESYFNIIAIVSTLYILVLSFRLDRFVRRTSDEEQRALTLLENITKLVTAKSLHRNARKFLMVIDSSDNVHRLRKSYNKMKTILFIYQQRAHGNNSDILVDKLAKIESEIEILALSKQQGNNFGELVSLMILGVIVIGGLLFTYPAGICGDEGIYVEIFAILLSTIVAFLLANIIDLQNDRNTPIMRGKKATKKKPWQFGIVFRDLQDRVFERWISLVICAIIIGAYIVLLHHKWADIPCG